MSDHEAFVRRCRVHVTKAYRKECPARDDELTPRLLVMEQGTFVELPVPVFFMASPDLRHHFMREVASNFLVASEIREVAFVCEAWVVRVPKDSAAGKFVHDNHEYPGLTPSQRPDRVEVVAINVFTPHETTYAEAEILRPLYGRPTLRNWRTAKQPEEEWCGAMSEPLRAAVNA